MDIYRSEVGIMSGLDHLFVAMTVRQRADCGNDPQSTCDVRSVSSCV